LKHPTDVVVDDHLLLRILEDDEPADLRRSVGQIFTTGLWYHRLCRALANKTVTGALSRRLGATGTALGTSAVQAVTSLPDSVGLLSLRELAWPMAQLVADGVRLDLLSLEALAAAEHRRAELCLATADENPTLLAAAATRGVTARLIGG
jgi:hypothetical protein